VIRQNYCYVYLDVFYPCGSLRREDYQLKAVGSSESLRLCGPCEDKEPGEPSHGEIEFVLFLPIRPGYVHLKAIYECRSIRKRIVLIALK